MHWLRILLNFSNLWQVLHLCIPARFFGTRATRCSDFCFLGKISQPLQWFYQVHGKYGFSIRVSILRIGILVRGVCRSHTSLDTMFEMLWAWSRMLTTWSTTIATRMEAHLSTGPTESISFMCHFSLPQEAIINYCCNLHVSRWIVVCYEVEGTKGQRFFWMLLWQKNCGCFQLRLVHSNVEGCLAYFRYPIMRDALNKTGRPIFFSMCEWWELLLP